MFENLSGEAHTPTHSTSLQHTHIFLSQPSSPDQPLNVSPRSCGPCRVCPLWACPQAGSVHPTSAVSCHVDYDPNSALYNHTTVPLGHTQYGNYIEKAGSGFSQACQPRQKG